MNGGKRSISKMMADSLDFLGKCRIINTAAQYDALKSAGDRWMPQFNWNFHETALTPNDKKTPEKDEKLKGF